MIAAWALAFAPGARAEGEPDAVTTWFSQVAGVNRPPMAEPAGSHGASGLMLSAGGSRHQAVAASKVANVELAGDDGEVVEVPRLWLVKGLPIPVDLLFTGGASRKGSFTQASGGAQWNIFEMRGLPTLGVRATLGRLFGCQATEAQTEEVAATASFGFLSYITLFGSAGVARHAVKLVAREDAETAFLLSAGQGDATYERAFTEKAMSIGVRLRVLPPFVALTGEATYIDGEPRAMAVALGFGL